MRILVTLNYYHPHWTGLTVVAQRLAEGLAARGHSVTVLTSRHEAGLAARASHNGVRVERVRTVGRLSRTVLMPSFPFAVARLVARNDVVHLHTPMPESPIVAGTARLMGKPTLITHHGDVVMPSGFLNGIIQRAMDGSIKLGMRLADRIVVHSADYHRHSRFLVPVVPKIENIYPPVTMPSPQPDAVAAWREELGLEDRRVVAFAGRFVEEKGFDYLLQAVPLVRERLPDAHFLFAGDTDVAYEGFFDRWRALFEEQSAHLTHVGLLRDAQQMANFYALADLFVLPSRTDCFAIVQIEALLSGTPLVTTDIPGAREIVRVTGAGRLVNPRDPGALAEGIVEVLENPGSVEPNPDDVRGVFDPKRSIDEYEELLLKLIQTRRKRGLRLRRRLLREG